MSKRFDEVELHPGTAPLPPLPPAPPPSGLPVETGVGQPAPKYRRALGFLTDVSLFAALGLALTPLVPTHVDLATTLERQWPALWAIAAFLVLVSFFYFVAMWLVWGRTIGGMIFNVRIAAADGTPADFRSLVIRWGAIYVSLLSYGLGFLLALLPGGRSLSDRLSNTKAESA